MRRSREGKPWHLIVSLSAYCVCVSYICVQTINADDGIIDLTEGQYAMQYEAAVRYVYGWIENRVINATKANMRTVQKGKVVNLVDSASEYDEDDEDDEGDDEDEVEDSQDEEEEISKEEDVAVEVSARSVVFFASSFVF